MRASLVLALTLALVPVSAAAQHAGHQHTPGAPSEGHREAQACLDEFDAVVRDGRGFGLAFAADQHGYPEVERARREVRLVHLLAHLKTREILTDAQRRAYHEARWPGR